MEAVMHEGTTVDRCRGCGGIWFDLFEAEDLIETETGAEIDSGKKIKGMQMDRIRDIDCPRCHKQMQTVSDREDPALTFEVCTACHGYFLDAGEFHDMANVMAGERLLETFLFKIRVFREAFKSMHTPQDAPE
jgi:Zn-finger nucleic acid-binding protein